MQQSTIKISKLDAARRQLETAITLWFQAGDPVSIHTLAFAAYEVIHAISKKRDPTRRDLLFDSLMIKDEHRGDFNKFMKANAWFFKHADRDGDSVIEFFPTLSEVFIMFAIFGVELCGERKNIAERAFFWWLTLAKPEWLTNNGVQMLSDNLKPEAIAHLRSIKKNEFFQAFTLAAAQRQG
jgi:hypothetical protein